MIKWGKALGAQLFIDDVVTNAARKLSGSTIESIGSLLYGEVDVNSNGNLSVGSSAYLTDKDHKYSEQDVSIFGALGKKQINVKSGDIAEVIANKINRVADETSVEATSSTQAMLSFENTAGMNLNDTVSFNLYGIDGTMNILVLKLILVQEIKIWT